MIKTAKELVAACLDAVNNHKTMYVLSCFGAPMNEKNKERYAKADPKRASEIRAASADTFGFDCVCFIKGLFWGWKGDASQVYGGAEYKSNGIPDIGADQLIKQCIDVSEDFSTIVPGEFLWLPGHCGIYVGDGLAAEATFEPESGVQLQCVLPMGVKPGMPATGWVKHGKLPWISYEEEPEETDIHTYRVIVDNLPSKEAAEALTDHLSGMGFISQLEVSGTLEKAPETETPIPAPAEPTWEPKEGDIVHFKGGMQYSSANGDRGSERPAGLAKITKTAPGKLHPYHLVKTGSQGPYGWVDRNTFEKG